MRRIEFIKYLLISFTILLSQFVFSQSRLSIEAASKDVTLVTRGSEKEISFINPSNLNDLENCIVLFSSTSTIGSVLNKVAVVVNEKMVVEQVVNTVGDKKGVQTIDPIPQGGFVLLASDDDYASRGHRKFLADNFRAGDLVKLRFNDDVKSLREVIAITCKDTYLSLELGVEEMFTSLNATELIHGKLRNLKSNAKYIVECKLDTGLISMSTSVDSEGNFNVEVSLNKGVNYFDILVYENNTLATQGSVTIYRKSHNKKQAEVVMWVEQFPNAKTLTSDSAIEELVMKCKEAGVTALGVDVKGPEGYVSYKKNDLSHSPYFTSTVNPKKKLVESDLDLLEAIVRIAHKHKLKVYASFNFFTEGNITTSDYAVLKEYPAWEEVVQRPDEKGKILKITETSAANDARAGKRILLAFVNPANKAVQDFQLLRVEEVLKNYAVDGVVMDRCRYDNLYADFSETSKSLFAAFLQQEGKVLEQFPADAFLIDKDGNMIEGKYFIEWLTFRSGVIKQFSDRLRLLVDKYKKDKNPNLQLAAYVGSWFEFYWQNGVNWSSEKFKYNDKLNFPESRLYTQKYASTSYTSNIDFLMIGTYYKTAKEVNKYITLGNILTDGELPLYGSMSLPDLNENEQADVVRASLQNSYGLMLFDWCYVKWPSFLDNMLKAKK